MIPDEYGSSSVAARSIKGKRRLMMEGFLAYDLRDIAAGRRADR